MKNLFISFILVMYVTQGLARNSSLLKDAATTQGFFFFYSASCPHCQRFAPLLKELSKRYGFKVLAISVDGGYLPSFPDAVMDEGQKRILQVSLLPSLFFVTPKSQKIALVSEGAVDEAELIRRLLTIIELQTKESQS